eukprot:TRINITY_DN357_c0_g1_i9.p1 TRINITY_DN357_c0_g1~~TRINITY_DN357_c0_g1_i9.p1  ORF type:complete len:582 (+),score=63.56 TRINITY_DN357_c0_g1_i9:184-1746(+)
MTKFLIDKLNFDPAFVTSIPCSRSPYSPAKPANKPVVEKAFQTMVDTARIQCRIKQDSLYFVYYSGHGCSQGDGDLRAFLPIKNRVTIDKDADRYIDLMYWVRMLASYENVYVVAFFDCCRTQAPTKIKTNYALVGGHLYTIFSAPTGHAAVACVNKALSEVTESFLQHSKRGGFESFPQNLTQWPAKKGKAEILDKASIFVDFSYKFKREETTEVAKLEDQLRIYLEKNNISNKEEQSKVRGMYNIFKGMDDDKNSYVSLKEIYKNLSTLKIKTNNDVKVKRNDNDYSSQIEGLNPYVKKELEKIVLDRCDRGNDELSFSAFIDVLNEIDKNRKYWMEYQEWTDKKIKIKPILVGIWENEQQHQSWNVLCPRLLKTLGSPELDKQNESALRRALCVTPDENINIKDYQRFVKLWIPRFPVPQLEKSGQFFLNEIRELYNSTFFKGLLSGQDSGKLLVDHPNTYHLRISEKQNRFIICCPGKYGFKTLRHEDYMNMRILDYIEKSSQYDPDLKNLRPLLC